VLASRHCFRSPPKSRAPLAGFFNSVLVQLAGRDEPPLRFAAGADAVELFKQKAQVLIGAATAHTQLSTNLAVDEPS